MPSDGNGRAAIIHFTTLPQIDPSMPIISANLKLSTYIGPNGVDLKLESMASGFNLLLDDYPDWKTWSRTEIDRAIYTSGTLVFEFDMTSCISDLYTGNISRDFSISLYDEDATTYVPTIHSANTPFGDSYRPCLTITYGYNLPEGLSVGDEITIQNAYGGNSGGYLYPNSGLIGNGNSVLHAPGATSSDTYRLLTLRQNSATGTYRLEYTPSHNSTGAYISADTTTKNVVMHNTTNVPSNIKQDWLIVPDSINTFKIVLASDMRYVMTAVGDTGTGYVSVAQLTNIPIGNQNNQSWLIYEDGAPKYGLAMTSPPLSTGIYYVNNKETGKFISYDDISESLESISGKVADIGDMIAWKITKLPDGYYTIQNANNLDEFLSVQSGSVVTGTCGETIPNIYKWRIEATSEYYYIKNVGANKYLYLDTNESTQQLYGVQTGNSGTTCKWRVANSNDYLEVENVIVNDIQTNVGYTDSIPIEVYPLNSTFSSFHDFDLRIEENDACAVLDTLYHKVTGNSIGDVEISITHKPTGITEEIIVSVGALLIYRTRNQEVSGFANPEDLNDIIPIIAEDLTYGQKNAQTMGTNGSCVSSDDLYQNGVPMTLNQRLTIINNFCNSQISYDPTFSSVLSEMFDHFVDGTGSDFANEALTDAVKNHENTQQYVNGVISVIEEELLNVDGHICDMYYSEQLWIQPEIRNEHIIVKAMQEKIVDGEDALYLPSYGYNNGNPGLTLAIDGWYGNKIEIESFEMINGTYSGVLRFTFYDHFGLDTLDLSSEKFLNVKAGHFPAFRQWYILQHWNDLGYLTQPRPFVTIVSFTVEFTGSL